MLATSEMAAEDGVSRALAFVPSAFSSYSGCRQYLQDIEQARKEVGPQAPEVDKLRSCFNHPGFIEPMVESVSASLLEIAEERRRESLLLFTAHSIPLSMEQNCCYVSQLQEACQLVAEGAGHKRWELVYQSRSGPPGQPWL